MEILLGITSSIFSGLALVLIGRWLKKSDKLDASRRRENVLILKNIDAIGCLAYQTARCLKGEKLNGDLDAAMKYRELQKHALEDHLMEVNAEHKC